MKKTKNSVYPSTYAEWNEVLDHLRDAVDDEGTLTAMRSGAIEWQTGVAERFTKKLVDVVNHRLNLATAKFQTALQRSNGEERIIVQAIVSLRRELRFLSKAVNLPAIPEEYRRQYLNLMTEQAERIQESLEKSAKKDRTGKLSSIIRSNRVDRLSTEEM